MSRGWWGISFAPNSKMRKWADMRDRTLRWRHIVSPHIIVKWLLAVSLFFCLFPLYMGVLVYRTHCNDWADPEHNFEIIIENQIAWKGGNTDLTQLHRKKKSTNRSTIFSCLDLAVWALSRRTMAAGWMPKKGILHWRCCEGATVDQRGAVRTLCRTGSHS